MKIWTPPNVRACSLPLRHMPKGSGSLRQAVAAVDPDLLDNPD